MMSAVGESEAAVEARLQVKVGECLGRGHLAPGRDLRCDFRLLDSFLDLDGLRFYRLHHWLRPLYTGDELGRVRVGDQASGNLLLLVNLEVDIIEIGRLEEQGHSPFQVGQLLRAVESFSVRIQ